MAQQIINTGTGPDAGDGDDLYVAFTKVNQNFNSLWQYGPVDSNIRIGNNSITATNTNGNVILNPQGVGVVQVNNNILPRLHNAYSLGTPDLRFRSAYFGTGGVEVNGNITVNGTLFGNISLGNLIYADLQGNVFGLDGNIMLNAANRSLDITTANVSANVLAGSLLTDQLLYANGQPYDFGGNPGGANTQIQFNDGGEFGGSPALTFDKASNALSLSGNVTAVAAQFNSVTANSFVGNGAGLTNLPIGGTLANGTSSVSIPVASSNIVLGVGLVPNVMTVTAAGATILGDLTVSGNIVGNLFVGDGRALTRVMAQRGADSDNWDTLTEMGVYKVNRTSWSGTTGTPLDSTVFKGLLQVTSETDGVTQIFFPGTVTVTNVKLQWARNYLNGVWTSWYKIVNDGQTLEGGTF